MTLPRLRPRAVLGLLVAASVLATGGASSAQALLAADDAPRAAVREVTAEPPVRDALAATVACEVVRGLRLCSHGDDAHLEGTAAEGGTGTATASTASTTIGCYAAGPRVQAVYARPVTAPDRYSASARSFQGWAGAIEKAVDDSAHKTKGARHVRFASTANGSSCTLSVLRVTLPTEAFKSLSATVSALRDLGLDKADVKYLVWADATGYCGVATVYEDDKASSDNLNNGQFPTYARIDRSCWGKAETHELMHMLGAVQKGAPHASQGLHCRDGHDVMCYDDGTRGAKQTTVCPSSHAPLLDCRGDDYFSTAPAAGSWLATHWNTANSAFLARTWSDPAPRRAAPPAPPASAAPSASPSAAPSDSPSAAPSPSPSPSPVAKKELLPLPLPVPLPTGLVQP